MPTKQETIDAALELQTELRARAPEMDEARRLPSDLAQTMVKAGMFHLLTPQSLGGAEVSPFEFMEILEALAIANASASWCTMIACTSTLPAAYLEPAIAKEIFGNAGAIVSGVFAPMGKAVPDGDHYILTGRWQWASNSANSNWMGCGAMVAGTKDARMLMFPTTDAKLIDTWHVAGLKGTGSGDIEVNKLRIPKSLSVSTLLEQPVEPGPLYTFPPFGILGIGVASVALGNAQGALNDFRDLAIGKKNQGSTRTLSERGNVRTAYAEAVAALKSARAYLVDEIEQTWADAKANGTQSLERRAELRLACTHMTRAAADTCRIVYDLGGGAVLFESSPIQRRFRDAHAITQHIATAPSSFDLLGRVLFGAEVNASMI